MSDSLSVFARFVPPCQPERVLVRGYVQMTSVLGGGGGVLASFYRKEGKLLDLYTKNSDKGGWWGQKFKNSVVIICTWPLRGHAHMKSARGSQN